MALLRTLLVVPALVAVGGAENAESPGADRPTGRHRPGRQWTMPPTCRSSL